MAHSVAGLTERVHDIEIGLKQGLLGGARAAAQLIPLAGLLVAISARTAAVAALTLLSFGALLGRARSGFRKALAQSSRLRTRLLEAADESVRHAELWVSYGAEERARASVRALGDEIARGSARLDARASAMTGANEVLAALALAAAIGAARAIRSDAFADGRALLAFAVAFFLAYRPIRELADARLAIARAAAAYDDLRPTLGGADARRTDRLAAPAVRDRGAETRSWPLARLELLGLTLVRGTCGPLTLRIEPGSIVAIAGATGVGKTTLLRTLLGFEATAGGQLLFDGVSIADAPAGLSGRPFAWVPQEAPLLADTVDANITLGLPDAPAGTAQAALEPIGAQHLLRSLDGARLGMGGRCVSGGERQWIALARAIATRQPILLLDEPTSGLDPESQHRVLQAISRLRGHRTVLIVTHRPEPLALADVIVRLDPTGALPHAA